MKFIKVYYACLLLMQKLILFMLLLLATKLYHPYIISVNSPYHWGEKKVSSHFGEKTDFVGAFKNTLKNSSV